MSNFFFLLLLSNKTTTFSSAITLLSITRDDSDDGQLQEIKKAVLAVLLDVLPKIRKRAVREDSTIIPIITERPLIKVGCL